MMYFLIWFVGLFVVPYIVKPIEAGYGIATLGSLAIWTISMFLLWIAN